MPSDTALHPQKYLGAYGLIVFIALLSAFIPLSTDLYLPALPGMSAEYGVSASRLNLTLTVFFIFFAFGTLVWGPLSDRYGRKPILVTGMVMYVIASGFCGLAHSVDGLIACRIFQALGGSAAGAVATAIVKDVYSGRKRESILAIVQSMVLISPAVAPVLGALLLNIVSWRGIFWSLSLIGVLALLGSLLYEETSLLHTGDIPRSSLGRLGKVLQNRGFTILLLLFSLAPVTVMSFVASSTYIYQDTFQLSSQMYSSIFLPQRPRDDRRPHALPAFVTPYPQREDHLGLLWHDRCQRIAGLPVREPPTRDICFVYPARFDCW